MARSNATVNTNGERLEKVSYMIDASICSGSKEVIITLDELRRAYNFGYSNGIDRKPEDSAPVEVAGYIFVNPAIRDAPTEWK